MNKTATNMSGGAPVMINRTSSNNNGVEFATITTGLTSLYRFLIFKDRWWKNKRNEDTFAPPAKILSTAKDTFALSEDTENKIVENQGRNWNWFLKIRSHLKWRSWEKDTFVPPAKILSTAKVKFAFEQGYENQNNRKSRKKSKLMRCGYGKTGRA